MRWIQIIRNTWRSLILRRKAEADLEEELRDHLEQEVANNIHAGMSPEEARFAAERLIGSISLFKDECRDQRGTAFLADLGRDLRYALQMLRRTPLFSIAAIATLALAIGANTFVFTFVENIVLHSIAAQNPDQLVSLNWGGAPNMSYPNYVTYRDQNTVFSQLAASRVNIVNFGLHPRASSLVWGYEATGNYFQMLGIEPQLGRFFTVMEDQPPGAHPVIVISDRYWHSHFAADPGVLGHTVKLNGYPFTIVGVAPPNFTGTELILACDFWVPMSMELEIEPGNDWYHERSASNIWVMGRLKPGVTVSQAQANLDQIAQQIARTYPGITNAKARFHLARPGLIGDALRTPISGIGVVLTALAAIVLLLACINLAGMLLARASDRHREIGIRLALGASRFRVVRQLMTESILLAMAGGAAGFATASVACSLFSSWRPTFNIPFNTRLQPDATVLGFTLAVAALATLIFGLAPALQSTRTDILPSLKDEPIIGRMRRLTSRDVLVIAQIALSVVLVICSVLVVRSLQNALTLKLGYIPDRAVSVSFDLRLKGYSADESRRFSASLLRNLSAIPGFEAVGLTSNLPLSIDHGSNAVVSRADRPVPKPSEAHSATIYNISPGYLRAAGTRLLSGREFDTRDNTHTTPVAIVNEALVHLFFPNESALGKNVRLSSDPSDKGLQIVGIVETGKYEYLGESPHPAVFLPIDQTNISWATVVARGSLPSQVAVELLRKAVLDANPELSVSNAGSLKDLLALPLFPARVIAVLLSLFGLLAMLLAGTGIFALMAYAVARRSREIGIRMALGARSGQVLAAIFSRTLALCAIGVFTGVICTLLAGRVLAAILYGVGPRDLKAYVSALVVVTTVSLLACWHPARRAVCIDPARTLRGE